MLDAEDSEYDKRWHHGTAVQTEPVIMDIHKDKCHDVASHQARNIQFREH